MLVPWLPNHHRASPSQRSFRTPPHPVASLGREIVGPVASLGSEIVDSALEGEGILHYVLDEEEVHEAEERVGYGLGRRWRLTKKTRMCSRL